MKPTRLTQPYRRGARAPSLALTAMLKGRSTGGLNPADVTRMTQRATALSKAGRRAKRPPRPKRPARPSR